MRLLESFVNILLPLWARARILAAVGALLSVWRLLGRPAPRHPAAARVRAKAPHPTHYVLVMEIGRRPTPWSGAGDEGGGGEGEGEGGGGEGGGGEGGGGEGGGGELC